MDSFISNLSLELKKTLPGESVQNKMSPIVRGDLNLTLPFREAAVLILLYPEKKKPATLFIKRTEYDGVHSGQISFPGGRNEKNDLSMGMTALRETEEEIGINSQKIKLIGQLTSLHIPVSNTKVYPFVGFIEKKQTYTADPLEVEYIIEAPIEEIINPLIVKSEKMKIRDIELEVPYFDISGHQIWGATAMILSEFIEIARGALNPDKISC